MCESHLGMPDFVETHLVHYGPGLRIRHRQGRQMTIKMGLNLALGFGKKTKVPFITQGAGEDTHR